MVFHKTESDSYAERTMWTRVAVDAFFTTNGSGWPWLRADIELVCEHLSSTGIIGVALLVLSSCVSSSGVAVPRTREQGNWHRG